jgi:hypothetical protein
MCELLIVAGRGLALRLLNTLPSKGSSDLAVLHVYHRRVCLNRSRCAVISREPLPQAEFGTPEEWVE